MMGTNNKLIKLAKQLVDSANSDGYTYIHRVELTNDGELGVCCPGLGIVEAPPEAVFNIKEMAAIIDVLLKEIERLQNINLGLHNDIGLLAQGYCPHCGVKYKSKE